MSILLLDARAAYADDLAEAKRHFAEGKEAFDKGEHKVAAEAFRRAFELAPRGAAAFNEGLAWLKAEEPTRAANAFMASLRIGGMSTYETRTADEHLTALRKQVGHVRIDAPEGTKLQVDTGPEEPSPAEMHLVPGTYTLRAFFSGGRKSETSIQVRTGSMTIVVSAPPVERAPAPAGLLVPKSPPPIASARTESANSNGVWGWSALGLGLALGAGAIWTGTEALSAKDRYYGSDFTDGEARDQASALRTWTNILWAGSAISGGAGAYLLLSGSSQDETDRTPRAGIGFGHLHIRGQF